jgi:hypothetical protein
MTENAPSDPTPADDVIDDDAAEVPETIEQARKLRAENKNLRSRLRAMQTDYEAAATRLAALEHAEVERHAANYLVDPTDIWRQEPDVQSYYDAEYKQIVGDRVRAAAEAIIAAKPHLAKPQSAPPPTQRPLEGLRSGAAPEARPKPVSWSSVLRGQ